MMLRLSRIMITAVILLGFSMTSAEGLDASAFLVMLGSKTVNPETNTNHNLDVFLGLAGLDLSAKSDNFEGFAEIIFFPAGYGFSYIQSADLDSATNRIVAKRADESRTTITNAWGRYTFKNNQIQIGRANLKYSNGFFFGDYLHRGSGPILDYGGSIQNCLQFQNTTSIFTTSILLGVQDINLDKGYLTFREVIKPNEKSQFALGYQGNIFDPIQNEDAVVLNNLSASAKIDYMAGQNVFAEFGMRGLGSENDDLQRFPVMLGFTIPTSSFLNSLSAEVEYDSKREDVENLTSFEFGLIAIKEFGKHFKAIGSLNTGSAKSAGVTAVNIEMIVSF